MAKVVVMIGDRVLREVHVGKAPVGIGRDPSNEIHLENPAASRFHAKIYRQGHPYFIEDNKSTNGVQVNGSTITWKCGLQSNDRITIGKHTLIFQEDPSDSADGKILDMAHMDGTVVVKDNKD